MKPDLVNWRQVWEDKSTADVSDFELDRGRNPGEEEVESLSERELIDFIAPEKQESVLDAGCGTGVNIFRVHSSVRRILGFDYAFGSVARCLKRVRTQRIGNAHVCLASVTAIPLHAQSVDKVLCLSVLQYLDDQEVRKALREFARVLAPGGLIILHVKNLASVYWSTLWLAKKIKTVLGRSTRLAYLRSFRWYVNELKAAGFQVVDYNSFNLIVLDRMPKRLLSRMQDFELRHRDHPVLRAPLLRRHGAELKIKARIGMPDA